MDKIWDNMKEVYDWLEDDLSKRIFESKIEWLMYGKEDKTFDILYDFYEDSKIPYLEKFHKGKECAIVGAGIKGNITYHALVHAGYKVKYYVDNSKDKQGTEKNGVPIISFSDFCLRNEDVIAVIDNLDKSSMFYHELVQLGYDPKKIFLNNEDIVRSSFGNIYFDLPELKSEGNEVFIDAGCFDGENSLEFIRWSKGNYSKIYALDPLEDGYYTTKNNLNGYENIEVMKCALGSEDGEANFIQGDILMASKMGMSKQENMVQVKSIDSILNGSKATFIKMDIEGGEMEALKGAVYTIQNYKPKLAISLYHKKEDIIEIPQYIKKILPEYKFYLRHYSNKPWDLVLYGV